MKVLILAGGFATRLWPLCENRAKPLLLLEGKTILHHIIDKIPQKYEKIILTNQKFVQDFTTEIKKIGAGDNTEIFCEDSNNEGEKLGALGAIAKVITDKKIDKNIIILAGDNILTDFNFNSLIPENNEAKLIIREVKNKKEAQKFGVLELKEKKVISFMEKPENPKSNLVSTGFISIGKDLLPILLNFAKKSPDALGGIFTEFLQKNVEVKAEYSKGDWFDIGSFETYLKAHKQIQKANVITKNLDKNNNNIFSGKVFIGENSRIKNCRLHNVIVYPNTVLNDCIISESIIDENCDLKGLDLNQKLIRKGTHLHS